MFLQQQKPPTHRQQQQIPNNRFLPTPYPVHTTDRPHSTNRRRIIAVSNQSAHTHLYRLLPDQSISKHQHILLTALIQRAYHLGNVRKFQATDTLVTAFKETTGPFLGPVNRPPYRGLQQQ